MPDAARSLVALAALAVACQGPILAVAGGPVATQTCTFECLRFTKNKYPSSILESYTVSTCRAKTSVILKTKKNRTLCANGDHDWVKKVMRDIDTRTIPSPSRYGTTTEKPPAANRHLGEAVLEVDGQVQPTKKVSTTSHKTAKLPARTTEDPPPFIERGLAWLETTTSSTTWLTPQPETTAGKSTLQSGSTANNKIRSETTEGHQRFRPHFTPTKKGLEDFARTTQRLVPFPGTDNRSTQNPAFVPETLTSTPPSRNSSLSKLLLEFVTKDKTLITMPVTVSSFSDQRRLSLSSFSTDHKPQSVKESRAPLPTNSSAPSSSDGNSLNSVRLRGVMDGNHKEDTTETSLFIGNGTSDRTFSKPNHPETLNESTLTSSPKIPQDCNFPFQFMVQNNIILVVSTGVVLCVLLAIGGLIYVKRNICTKQSSKRQIQGLFYYPCDSQAESYPMARGMDWVN